ncbi:hypothetical protein BAUCODRAFT_33657 [Baudoinia panamericana UAMH 10762]|uniref:DNA-directed RNA polymerase III subunit RPC3 n=1 Tax=Baudoinia panamericana (strain UAMH 10762) TaxID=717646 RepID=M2NAZ0_BAUPA|nr:uncharacterized protein BAUCODRAFT_33657 [Baudoinia panamericana UAMH 10762]EMC96319.1 hypothetical protein BAUCODRAFT_33657 [Baudoinia panamericana UAMH 10762]
MAKYLAELCTILVQNHLGEVSAQIFSILAEHGRLTTFAISDYADVPIRRVRSALATLLEEQLLLHYRPEDEPFTYYSINWRNAYNLARHQNIIELVADRYGDGAAQIVKNILQLGHARVGDLVDAYGLTPGSKRDSGVETTENHGTEGLNNGDAKTVSQKTNLHVTEADEFHTILGALIKDGILAKVGSRAFMPITDLQEEIEEAVIVDRFPDRKVTGPKKQKEFSSAVDKLKRKWQDDDAFDEHQDYESRGSIKRAINHAGGPSKRLKVNGNLPNGHATEPSAPKLANNLIVRVDCARCTVALRSHRLCHMAKRALGGVTGAVYDALLKAVERNDRSMRVESKTEDDADSESPPLAVASVTEIAEILDPALNLAAAIDTGNKFKHQPNGTSKSHGKNGKTKIEAMDLSVKHSYPSDSDSDEPIPNGLTAHQTRTKRHDLIEKHLALLAEHPNKFCQRSRSHGGWSINFPALTSTLITSELDTTLSSRYSKHHLRLTRMLRSIGKLEEKSIASLAMMRIKDVRELLTELQYAGIVDVQELPKDGRRQPSNTIFLWYCDEDRVRKLVVEWTYKAMARCLQRLETEREKFRTVIDKAERGDVRGAEEEKLTRGDLEALRRWREVEEQLRTQVARCDEVVAVLRDFAGGGEGLEL